MKRILCLAIGVIFAASCLFLLTSCDGPNSSSWTVVVNNREETFSGGFSQSVGSARSGHRNRTFDLTAAELANIHVDSSSEGTITLTISQDGELDGTEVVLDVSNFSGNVDAGHLDAGRIRLTLRHEGTRNTNTTIRWR